LSNDTPDISVVIVSFNVKEYLCKCIDSLLAQRNIGIEIIVVDNNSKDGTLELIKAKYPSVKVIVNPNNVGFSTANNQGIKESSGAIILLLNPDTEIVGQDALSMMKNYSDTHPQTAILAPCLVNSDGTFQSSFWNYPGVKAFVLELFYLHRGRKIVQPNGITKVEAASGAALVFKKSLINEIGGLDEDMFWMEDTDFCYRARKTGKSVTWIPAIKIIHHGGKSSAGNEHIAIPNQVLSRIKFSKKHNSKPEFYLLNIISLLFIYSRLFVLSLLSPFKEVYNAKRKAYVVALKSYIKFNFRGDNAIIK
jgi:GT2 family glycosyltransferase